MVSVGKHSQATCGGVSHRLHRFTRILGTGKKDTNHTDVAQEKSVTIRGICGKTFSQEKSVRICEIRGTTSLKQRAEESPTDYADLHGYWVREKGHESHGRSIRKICDNPWNLWDNILSSKIRENLWDNITQAACGGVSHRLRRFTRILGAVRKNTNSTNHTDAAQEKNL